MNCDDIYLNYLFNEIKNEIKRLNIEMNKGNNLHLVYALTQSISCKMRLYVAIRNGKYI